MILNRERTSNSAGKIALSLLLVEILLAPLDLAMSTPYPILLSGIPVLLYLAPQCFEHTGVECYQEYLLR